MRRKEKTEHCRSLFIEKTAATEKRSIAVHFFFSFCVNVCLSTYKSDYGRKDERNESNQTVTPPQEGGLFKPQGIRRVGDEQGDGEQLYEQGPERRARDRRAAD